MEDDKVLRISKNDTVELDDGSILYILSYYVKGLYERCSVKVQSSEKWREEIESLAKDDPAMFFTLSDIGIEGSEGLGVIYAGKRKMTRMLAYNLLDLKFSPKKLRKPMDFVNEEFYMMGNVTKPYLRKYSKGTVNFDILDLAEIPKGEWFTAEYLKFTGKHRKPRIVM